MSRKFDKDEFEIIKMVLDIREASKKQTDMQDFKKIVREIMDKY